MKLKYEMENIIRELNHQFKPYNELVDKLEHLKNIYGEEVVNNYLYCQLQIPDLYIKIVNTIPNGIACIDNVLGRIKITNKCYSNIEYVLHHEYMHQILWELCISTHQYDNIYNEDIYL